jgi:signal peptidase I
VYNRWYWYLLAVLIGVFVLRPAAFGLLHSRWLQAFRIPSAAMEPTLLIGDFIFASVRPSDRQPRRHDIVIFESPTEAGLLVIKRVVGLPGDTLTMKNGVLALNGVSRQEAFAQGGDSAGADGQNLDDARPWHVAHLVQREVATYRPTTRNWGPLVVPRDSVFLLGDNRDESFDSRFYGAVGLDRIRGRPLKIYFSFGSQDGHSSVRWSRIGHRF